jgi:hypothetical protein
MKIVHRFGALCAGSIALLVLLGGVAGAFVVQLREQVHDIDQAALQPVLLLARLDAALLSSRLQAAAGLMHDPANPVSKLHDHPTESHAAAIDRALQSVQSVTKALRAIPVDAAAAKALQALADDADDYAQKVGKATAVDLRDDRWEAVGTIVTLSNRRYVELKSRIDAAAKAAAEHAEQTVAASATTTQRALTVLVAVLALSIVGFSWAAWSSVRSVRRSTRAAQSMAEKLAHLDLRPDPVPAAHDEIGMLCRSIHQATQALAQSFAEVQRVAGSVGSAVRKTQRSLCVGTPASFSRAAIATPSSCSTSISAGAMIEGGRPVRSAPRKFRAGSAGSVGDWK